MGPVEAVRSCLRQYARFSGRARRSEYWWFQFAVLVFSFAFVVLLMLVLALTAGVQAATGQDSGSLGGAGVVVAGGIYLVMILVLLALALPSLAVSVRRLHDVGRSGWWVLLGAVPFGGIVLLVFHVQDTVGGPNPYGPPPKVLEPGPWTGAPNPPLR
ncbi:DUF805 domain-containing protein [Kineococcus gynurae]|uniref:DUF805 domain-containing protein n=1 Tax=Kineococcus gynurae TaxID=452979 RepID=A0ABV5LQT4_9ACTN